MEKKITKKMNYAELLDVVNQFTTGEQKDRLTDFINHEVELIVKKNSAERKPTANQLENEKIKNHVLTHMVKGQEYTATELIKNVLSGTEWAELSVSRMTAILTQLVEDNSITRDYKKRKALFSLID